MARHGVYMQPMGSMLTNPTYAAEIARALHCDRLLAGDARGLQRRTAAGAASRIHPPMNELFDRAFGFVASKTGDATNASWLAYRMLFAPGMIGPARMDQPPSRGGGVLQCAAPGAGVPGVPGKHGATAPQASTRSRRWTSTTTSRHGRSRCSARAAASRLRDAVIDESSGIERDRDELGARLGRARGDAAPDPVLDAGHARRRGLHPPQLLRPGTVGNGDERLDVAGRAVHRQVDRPRRRQGTRDAQVVRAEVQIRDRGLSAISQIAGRLGRLRLGAYDVSAIVGGEGMSESLRAALNRRFRRTISSFGASDLEINLAIETPFTVALREAIVSDDRLRRDIYGGEGLPMIFQYDPLDYCSSRATPSATCCSRSTGWRT